MSKSKKRYTVLLSATENNLKAEGFNRWVKKNQVKVSVFLAITAILTLVAAAREALPTYILFGAWLIIFVSAFFRTWSKTGKEFFNKIKDMPEPIDLREVK